MTCSQIAELFAAQTEGLLDEAAAQQLETHLAECSACREALDETRRLIDRLEECGRDAAATSIVTVVMDRIVHQQALRLRRYAAMRGATFRVGVAAVLIGAGLALFHLKGSSPAGVAFAADLSAASREVQGAKTATWRVTYYEQCVSADRTKRLWFRDANNDQRYAYKSPGLYRCESLGKDGKAVEVSIEDLVRKAKLVVNHGKKTATLSPLGAFPSMYNPRGPFAKYLDLMRRDDLQWLGKKAVAGREANGFRAAFFEQAVNSKCSLEFWIGAKDKKLVTCQDPGSDVFNTAEIVPDKAVAFPTDEFEYDGTKFRGSRDALGRPGPWGHVIEDIKFDVALADSLFSLEPPEGYALRRAQPPEITEKDVLEFLGVVADYFGKTFPDRLLTFNHEGDEYDRFEKVEVEVMKKWRGEKPAKEPTPAEVRMVEAMHKWWRTWIPGPGPMHVFVHEQVVKGSWKYLGKGVKLGDKTRVVCWYRLKGAETYRVVYGDLSVKDVAPEGLPLPVEK